MITNEQHEREQAEAEERAIETNLKRDSWCSVSILCCLIGFGCGFFAGKISAAERPNSSTVGETCKLLVSGQDSGWRPQAGQVCENACDVELERRRALAAPTKTSGSTRFTCRNDRSTTVSYQRNPVTPTCPGYGNLLTTRSQTCPSGFTGSWGQTASFSQAPYPSCTVTATWSPTTPPEGACTPVPPPTCTQPPDRPSDCPEGYSGLWMERATVTGTPPNCVVNWWAINPMSEACTPASQARLFLDRFEYDISRSTRDADAPLRSAGWSLVKANNASIGRGSGWVYTRQDAARGGRVLVLESNPQPISGFPVAQTDYYVQRGAENGPTSGANVAIPANAWIQFWTHAAPGSRFSTRDKTIYPCRGAYPCHPTWLFMWGAMGFEENAAPEGGRYLALEGEGADRDTRVHDGQERKLYQNVAKTPLLVNKWYQVRLHIDISGSQGIYEAWIRESPTATWTKVADWRGGVTANFTWPIADRRGFNVVRIPTTVNAQNNTVSIDDFTIAETQGALP